MHQTVSLCGNQNCVGGFLFKEQIVIDDSLLEHKVRQLAVISYKQGKHEKTIIQCFCVCRW